MARRTKSQFTDDEVESLEKLCHHSICSNYSLDGYTICKTCLYGPDRQCTDQKLLDLKKEWIQAK